MIRRVFARFPNPRNKGCVMVTFNADCKNGLYKLKNPKLLEVRLLVMPTCSWVPVGKYWLYCTFTLPMCWIYAGAAWLTGVVPVGMMPAKSGLFSGDTESWRLSVPLTAGSNGTSPLIPDWARSKFTSFSHGV